MGLLDGKVALIFGVANKNSIAWGIAQSLHAEGATIVLSYAMEKLERRVVPLGEQIGSELILEADVGKDDDLDRVFDAVKDRYGKLDILVHSVAFAPREDLGGRFVDVSRKGLLMAIDISAYSLLAMARRAEPLMPEGGSIMSLTYFAAEKVIAKYNAMAVAKAALETITRYLAVDLGPGKIRVNTISAGPIKTLSAGGVQDFRELLKYAEASSPLRENISTEDVGQAAVFLGSDMGRFVTGETLHVDSGYNVLGYSIPSRDLENKEWSFKIHKESE